MSKQKPLPSLSLSLSPDLTPDGAPVVIVSGPDGKAFLWEPCQLHAPDDRARLIAKIHKTYEQAKALDLEERLVEIGGEVVRRRQIVPGAARGKRPQFLPDLLNGADVVMRPRRWLWLNRFPRGKLSRISGEPNIGKTNFIADMTARITTGREWPDGSPGNEPGTVIFIHSEDEPDDTLCPRMLAAGANLSRVELFRGGCLVDADGTSRDAMLDLSQHAEHLAKTIDQAAARTGSQVDAIFVDPLQAFTGKVDCNSNSEVRQLLAAISKVAAEKDVAFIFVNHNRKSTGSAMHSALGSIGFNAAMRAVWTLVKDPDDPDQEQRLFLPVKSNLAPQVDGLAYRIVRHSEAIDESVIQWGDAVTVTAEDIARRQGRRETVDKESKKIVDILKTMVERGPRSAKEILEAGREAGWSPDQLKRAKKKAGIESDKTEFDGEWVWRK